VIKDNRPGLSISSDAQLPVGLESLCAKLAYSGFVQLHAIAVALDANAPSPGSLVFVQARRMGTQVDGMQPVLFAAIDACTHLQAMQGYLVMTTAAAASFTDYLRQAFPFGISEIRTREEAPFGHKPEIRSHGNYTTFLRKRGIAHSFVTDPAADVLATLPSRMMFGGILEGSIVNVSMKELQRDLGHFLFYHNNYRPVPWFAGQTPLQKLRSFKEFAGIHSFDAFVDSESGTRKNEFSGSTPSGEHARASCVGG
jgi:hypothetical protein